MSKRAYDVFALIFNVLGNDWQPKHVTSSLFKAIETIRQALAKNLTKLLDKHDLRKKSLLMSKTKDLI
jgi:hypothetical protein